MHRQQITVQDAGIAHAHALHPQQVMGAGAKQPGIQPIVPLDVLLGENRPSRRHPPHHRQARLGGVTQQADAPRGSRQDLHRALAHQRLQVILRGVDRAEAEPVGDLRAGGRETVLLHELLDECQNLILAGGQRQHGEYDSCRGSEPAPAACPASGNIYSIRGAMPRGGDRGYFLITMGPMGRPPSRCRCR